MVINKTNICTTVPGLLKLIVIFIWKINLEISSRRLHWIESIEFMSLICSLLMLEKNFKMDQWANYTFLLLLKTNYPFICTHSVVGAECTKQICHILWKMQKSSQKFVLVVWKRERENQIFGSRCNAKWTSLLIYGIPSRHNAMPLSLLMFLLSSSFIIFCKLKFIA